MLNWYLQNGKDSDVVVSSRIRLARNFNNIPFTTKFSKEQAQEVKNKVKEITPSIGYGLKFIDLNDLDDVTKISLIEKNLITAEFAMNKAKVGAILINDEENICIMINDEDHIRMQFFSSGLELENLKNLAVEIDEKIAKLLPYAVSKKYGYLTACPTNVGTAMKASVIVHLPALTMTNNINKILNVVNNFGMNIYGLYGDETQNTSDIYEISNNQTLGITEEDIIQNIKVVTEKLIEQERNARKFLDKDKISLEDTIYRSYGLLTNCRKITLEETEKLLSNVK